MPTYYGPLDVSSSGAALQTSILTSDQAIRTRWGNIRNVNSGSFGEMNYAGNTRSNDYSTTTPTTTNGNFAYTGSGSLAGADQGFLSPNLFNTSIPAGEWTFQMDVTTQNATGGSTRFTGYLFVAVLGIAGFLSVTNIPAYSDAALTTSIRPTTNTVNSTENNTATYSTTFYCDSVNITNGYLFFQVWNEIVTSTTQRVALDLEDNPNNFNDIGVALIAPDPRRRVFVIS